jgi:hypothetical protein
MVWTEVSWLLAAVAAVLILVALVAIVLTEITRPKTYPRVYGRRLPDNAELRDEDRLRAIRRFARERGEGNG